MKTNLEHLLEVSKDSNMIEIKLDGYVIGVPRHYFEDLNKEYVPPKPKTVYDLKYGDVYYGISSRGYVIKNVWMDSEKDDGRREQGNIFLTEKDAEFELERRKVYAIVKKYSYDFTEEEWESQINKFYPEWCKGEIDIDKAWRLRWGILYFKSKDDVQAAIDEVGKDRFVKYYLGVK